MGCESDTAPDGQSDLGRSASARGPDVGQPVSKIEAHEPAECEYDIGPEGYVARDSGFLERARKTSVAPNYPEEARRLGIEGAVPVEIVVDREGKVVHACAQAGHPLLRDAAVKAALQWEFKPYFGYGQPEAAPPGAHRAASLPFNFVLEPEDGPSQPGNPSDPQ